MNMTIEKNTINTINPTMEAKLREDIQHLQRQLGYARRTPQKMSAFYGFTFIETNGMGSAVEITFNYEGAVLLHVLLHDNKVSMHKFGLEHYTLSLTETMELFEALLPDLNTLSALV